MSTDNRETYVPGVLRRREPDGAGVPLVFDIPRSGAEYPRDFRSPTPFDDAKSSISMYLETLFEAAPAHCACWIFACFPNAYIDANRHESNIDPSLIENAKRGGFYPTKKSELDVVSASSAA